MTFHTDITIDVAEVRRLRRTGLTIRAIASRLKRAQSTVGYHVRTRDMDAGLQRCPHCGGLIVQGRQS